MPVKRTPTKPQTTRQQLVSHVKPLLPRGWKIVPYSRNLDRLAQTTVMFHATEIRPGTSQGTHEVDFVVSISSPKTDSTNAQIDLDDDVLALVHALDTLPWLMFRQATPTTVQDALSWDVTVTVITRKD